MTTTKATPKEGVQKLNYSEAEQMLRQGKTQKDVADAFGVTQSAVAVAIRRGRINYKTTGYAKGRAMPWVVREEHQQKYLARMLRAYHRRQQGLTNAAVLERMLVTFLRSMEAADAVVHYDPELDEGFIRVKRRPGIDTHPLIRDPGLDDDGKPIVGPKVILTDEGFEWGPQGKRLRTKDNAP